MVQPLVITKQEVISDKIKLHFTINKPGVFEYVPEYCAYSLDNGGTWYKAVEARMYGHNEDPLFVPQGGQGFIYVFDGPSADDLTAAGTLFPEVISRLTLIERDCHGAPPETPPYMDSGDPPETGGLPPFTGQPPVTGQPPIPPITGQPPAGEVPPGQRDPRDPQPPPESGGPTNPGDPGDPGPGAPPAPSPGTPSDDPEAPDTYPPGSGYPGYPGGPGDIDPPPTADPNDPAPPNVPPEHPPGSPGGDTDPGGGAPADPPLPGDDVPPTPEDQGPGTGTLDPRPTPPDDEPTPPPGGFNPAPPVPTDPEGEGGPSIPDPLPGDVPTAPPVTTDPPPPPPLIPPGTPGAGDLPVPIPGDPGGDDIPLDPPTPIDPVPVPTGTGGVTLPPEFPDEQPTSDGPAVLPPTYEDPHAPETPDGNVDGLPINPAISEGAAIGVPAPAGSDEAFPYESGTSAWTPTQPPDMGEPGTPIFMIPPGDFGGVTIEVYAMPDEVHHDTSVVVVTARVVNVSYPTTLPEARIVLEFVAPDGRIVWLGESTRFNLPVNHYYSVSKVVPSHSMWPPGAAHVHAILISHETPVGDAINTLDLMNIPEAVY